MAAYDYMKNAPKSDDLQRLKDAITGPRREGRGILPDKYKQAKPETSLGKPQPIVQDLQIPERTAGGAGGDGNAAVGNQLGGDPIKTTIEGDNDSQYTNLPFGPESGPDNATMGQDEVTALGAPANAFINKQQDLRSQRENAPNAPAPQRFGGFDQAGNKIGNTGGGTFNVVDTSLGGKSIVERARAFSEQRRARSPMRRQTTSNQPSPFAQRKEARERRMQYNSILSNAGAGPNKDISTRAALGIIAQMEGDRMRQQTAMRGQDIGAETSDLDRNATLDIAENRQRVRQSLGEMDVESRSLDRSQQAQLQADRLAQDASQFEATQGLKGTELENEQAYREQQIAASIAEARIKAKTEREKQLFGLAKESIGSDLQQRKVYNPDAYSQSLGDIFLQQEEK